MKTIALSLIAAALLLGISLAPLVLAKPNILEGKDKPQMAVTATLLPS